LGIQQLFVLLNLTKTELWKIQKAF
jgi:hypothetical protein